MIVVGDKPAASSLIIVIYLTGTGLALAFLVLSLDEVAGCVFVGGAIGVEKWTDRYDERNLLNTLAYNLWNAVEEGMEMRGVVLFIHALLEYMRLDGAPRKRGSTTLSVSWPRLFLHRGPPVPVRARLGSAQLAPRIAELALHCSGCGRRPCSDGGIRRGVYTNSSASPSSRL